MKEELIRIVRETENNLSAWNRAREYLQARILGLLQETGAISQKRPLLIYLQQPAPS